MQINIRLFATLKERAGAPTVAVDVAEPATVGSLVAALGHSHPQLADALPVSIVAVNRAFADPETPLAPGDEVAIFPPVSGGD